MTREERTPPGLCSWELTRDCELRCVHCRSVDGGLDGDDADRLEIGEALEIADQIVELGVKLVVLTGGEPTRFEGWDRLAKRLTAGGVMVRLFTNGLSLDEVAIDACRRAGVGQVAISLDGPREVHDWIRRWALPDERSPFELALASARRVVRAGLSLRIVTQVNRRNAKHLIETWHLVRDLGARRWQLQLIQMIGEARKHRQELLPEAEQLESIVEVLLRVAREARTSPHGVLAPMHCTIGYMTREEALLRGRETQGRAVWMGCPAGLASISIMADARVKGCAALPDEMAVDSLRERTIAEIWNDDASFLYARDPRAKVLEGECARCAFGRICRAGCPAVAYGATGNIGANPYCLKIIRE
jgi:radical SAM protein with 4Fe4S-binding SPASM domain